LGPGETCVFYTDGVTEAIDAQGEVYGRKRLSEAVRRAPLAVRDLVHAVVEDVERFYGDLPQRDDVCIVAARRT
jgi:sigma-B regulation protein RsbU (phosphoserine phosphatase)